MCLLLCTAVQIVFKFQDQYFLVGPHSVTSLLVVNHVSLSLLVHLCARGSHVFPTKADILVAGVFGEHVEVM